MTRGRNANRVDRFTDESTESNQIELDRKTQGICFLGKLKFDEFLLHYLGTSPGTIVDQTGRPIGEHRGLWFHTIGQRKGVGPGLVPGVVNLGPWYVADKDMETNVLVVTNDREAVATPSEAFPVRVIRTCVTCFPCFAKSHVRPTDPG